MMVQLQVWLQRTESDGEQKLFPRILCCPTHFSLTSIRGGFGYNEHEQKSMGSIVFVAGLILSQPQTLQYSYPADGAAII